MWTPPARLIPSRPLSNPARAQPCPHRHAAPENFPRGGGIRTRSYTRSTSQPGPGELTALLTTAHPGRSHLRRPRVPYLGSGGGRRRNNGRGLHPLRDRFT
jgi:hypothetical protein